LATALKAALRAGYGAADFRADALAGLTVGIVALPLSMALAIASGMPPMAGIYTAIVAGFVSSLLGGSATQVSGPTAAFVVVLVPIAGRYGAGGLLLATGMAGVLLIAMGAARMGQLIQWIPYPVTTGFTAGIAVVIATLQLKDFLGLPLTSLPDRYLERVATLAEAMPDTRPVDLGVGVGTLAVLLLWPRISRRVPAPLVALALATGVTAVFQLPVATIGSRFPSAAAGSLPHFAWPWMAAGADGAPIGLSWGMVEALFPAACAIAMLGAIESLLSAVVADGMAGSEHDPDAELIAQGASNLIAPFFGGFASTGAIARTATNIRAGARSPMAAAIHAVFLLAALLVLGPLLASLPMASLAALLLLVAWNMSDAPHVLHMLRVAPRSDVVVLVACFLLTVLFDMVVAVAGGVVLAALLFMRRMAEISGTRTVARGKDGLGRHLPEDVILYQVAGPLFFGAAQKAMRGLAHISSAPRVVILDLTAVPVLDATGLVGLESAVEQLYAGGTQVLIAGAQPQPMGVLNRADFGNMPGVSFVDTVESAIRAAKG
jgi:sulfate permease, SulP family